MVQLHTGLLIKINTLNFDVLLVPEAAVRSQKQAESEDFNQVDIEHFEKILPQLVCHSIKQCVSCEWTKVAQAFCMIHVCLHVCRLS